METIPRETDMKYPAIASCILFFVISITAYADASKPEQLGRLFPDERYVAGLGEIMTATQIRHAKLWFAGHAENWNLASYELDEIEEGFENVTKFHPVFNEMPVASLLEVFTSRPLDNIRHAIESRDGRGFSEAFAELTAACNSCHHAANRGFIIITRPEASPVTNQEYAVDTLK